MYNTVLEDMNKLILDLGAFRNGEYKTAISIATNKEWGLDRVIKLRELLDYSKDVVSLLDMIEELSEKTMAIHEYVEQNQK